MSAANGRQSTPPPGPIDGAMRPALDPDLRPSPPRVAPPAPWHTHVRSSALLLALILVSGCIAFPLAVVGFADVFAPSTASGQPYAGENQSNSTAVNNSPPPVATVHLAPGARVTAEPATGWMGAPAGVLSRSGVG